MGSSYFELPSLQKVICTRHWWSRKIFGLHENGYWRYKAKVATTLQVLYKSKHFLQPYSGVAWNWCYPCNHIFHRKIPNECSDSGNSTNSNVRISFCRHKEPVKILESSHHILNLCFDSFDNNTGNMLLSFCSSWSGWILWLYEPFLEKHTFHDWIQESLEPFLEAFVASCGTFLTISDDAKSNSHEIS